MAKRAKIGDVIEIKLNKGVSYAVYTHKNNMYGPLLRIFNHIYMERPTDFNTLFSAAPTFSYFFPLGAAVSRGIVTIVGNIAVPVHMQDFPIFRTGTPNPVTNKVSAWWLWDGENEWCVGEITQEQRKLSILGIVNDTYLVEKIESGWTPENDVR
ncbi:MAG: hypothetical protein Ta2G_12280 [Termitinemataceae bacterium]|nr:MAG: hypothetical protein Ta2G_12280 [Termitinemataceae bacterium]